MKSRIVVVRICKRRTHSKAQDGGLAMDTALSIIQKPNHNKSSSILFITMLLYISTIDKFAQSPCFCAWFKALWLWGGYGEFIDRSGWCNHSKLGKMKPTKLLIDFTMEKTDDDKDISRDSGHRALVLNENHRNEITHFTIKPLPILSK
jgi:hypothetical protein